MPRMRGLCWSENFHSQQVGGKEFVDLILTGGVLNDGKQIRYAFGINVDEFQGRRRYSHGGAWLGFRCYWGHFPDEHTTILIFGNHGKGQLHQDEVAEIYFRGRE